MFPFTFWPQYNENSVLNLASCSFTHTEPRSIYSHTLPLSCQSLWAGCPLWADTKTNCARHWWPEKPVTYGLSMRLLILFIAYHQQIKCHSNKENKTHVLDFNTLSALQLQRYITTFLFTVFLPGRKWPKKKKNKPSVISHLNDSLWSDWLFWF